MLVTGTVDVVDVEAMVAVLVAVVGVATGLEVVAEVVVVVNVEVDDEQDATTSDVTMRQANAIQITPLFIWPP
jgi:hypothetical protein